MSSRIMITTSPTNWHDWVKLFHTDGLITAQTTHAIRYQRRDSQLSYITDAPLRLRPSLNPRC